MATPVIEQAKIQAQVLVPLIKTLQAELGEERANALVRKAIGELYRRLGRDWWIRKKSESIGSNMASAFASFAKANALNYTVRTQSDDAYEIDVTRCQYAEFYKELGEPELGFLLICSADFPFADGFGAEVDLTRTKTIMEGACHCDFRYSRQRC
ncbi:L-2-amino-thiazoline-4-carboxylic acid hydrolase [Hyphomicrobium sp. CS1BSMeth3]|uniref:L-2-amino-thiazoline-4-carboxylic acid hydrolase n=1 Tax=Hyphomicrobium sp. CS1BSMeth3 TaxID=1892844 RepID=UPI0009314F0A|nr:L-2-amino-thiazoline-4-carboxylic acid hydrolase [Hyphomicrobium sp. CS1BSMeth3]